MEERILDDAEWAAEMVRAAAELRRAAYLERKARAAEEPRPWVI